MLLVLALAPNIAMMQRKAKGQSTSFTFSQNLGNTSRSFSGCRNTRTITFTPTRPPPPSCLAPLCD
ncbi:MAG TPA: hypothetical protein VE818_09930 [Nitrososphaeraceae archaeon]|nr:hypothetical protein [Nitrososphaeraceae archaeon]